MPSATQSVVVVCEDPDAPFPEPFVHRIVYGIRPSARSLDAQTSAECQHGKNSKFATAFIPAAPPHGHGVHHYHYLAPYATLPPVASFSAGKTARSIETSTYVAWSLAGLAFILFAAYRVRFVGGCDSSSYLLESLQIRGMAGGLSLDPGVPIKAPLAPLCMIEHDGHVGSFFPMGFPVLLALAGRMRLEFYVTPGLGATSGLALFYALRPRLGPAIALGAMVTWTCSPVVFWGSTQLMSDLPAAAFAIFSLLALRRARPTLSGVLLGFSLGIRPTQALAAPAFLLMAPNLATRIRLVLGMALAVGGWGILYRAIGDAPIAYGDNLVNLDGSVWGKQLTFLLGQTLALHLPIVALALIGLVARPRAVLPLAIWFCAFLALYTLWRWPFDAWWWMRYMLPALPALFLAAAEGAAVLRSRFGQQHPALLSVGGAALVAGYAAWTLLVSPAKDHAMTTFDEHYARDSVYLSRIVPEGSLVGALNHSGPLRLYARLQSFFWCHRETPALLRWALSAKRPVFVVLDEAESKCNLEARALATQTGLVTIATLPSGKLLQRLDLHDPAR